MSIFAKKQRIVKRKKLIITILLIIIITVWWRAPIFINEWNKQTIYVGLYDVWYGKSKDDKAYAMWIDDDSTIGVFKVKKIADALNIPSYYAIVANNMEQEVADSLASWQRQGAGILLHGLSHELWKEWDEAQIEYDIHQSNQRLQEQGFDTTKVIKMIVPPHGSNTKTIRKVIKRHGCKMISGATLVNPDRHVFQLGRISINPDTDIDFTREVLEKAYKRKAFVIFCTHSSIPESFSVEKTQEILRLTKEMGFCFDIYE